MELEELICALRRMKVETGSLVCMGCGHEHSCGIHGCALIRAAADELEAFDDFERSQMHALLESLTAANRQIADLQAERDAAIDHVRSAEGCWGCKFAVDGATRAACAKMQTTGFRLEYRRRCRSNGNHTTGRGIHP